MAQHADVISSVAEGHGLFQLDAEVADNLVDTVLLGVSFGCHVYEGRMPAAHLAVGDGGQDDCFFLGVDKGSQLEEGFVGMAVGIGLCFDGVHFQLVMEDFLHYFAGLVHADVVLSHQDAWDVAFVAESCQGIHFRCRYGAFVDNGVFYKAIGAVHRDVAVYQIPFLQGGQVVDDDARTSGRMKICMPLALAAVNASIVETGISWVLKLTKVPSMSKNRAFIIRGSFILCAKLLKKAKIFRTFAHK